RAAVEGRTFTSVTNFGTAPVSLPEGSVVLTSGPLTPDGQLPTDTSAWVIK
ncbi:alpha-amylase, partial [Bifidobacterium longum subsp. longum]